MQVSSRFLLVWLIVDPFPWLARSPVYTSMLLAWSVTEVIRYSFFAFNLTGNTPDFLVWLRYNSFFVLYPVGILSECGLIWAAVEPAHEESQFLALGLYAVLLIYIPGEYAMRVRGTPRLTDSCAGSYILYTHMMAQRRKVLRSLKAKNEEASK